jgi:hypothetical protein
MADDYYLLGLGGMISLVTNIQVSSWGAELLLECVYDPRGERLPYQLIFKDCQYIRWDVQDSELVNDLEADLIGIHLGEGSHRQPAVIHTDIFEISILYGSWSVHKFHQVQTKMVATDG